VLVGRAVDAGLVQQSDLPNSAPPSGAFFAPLDFLALYLPRTAEEKSPAGEAGLKEVGAADEVFGLRAKASSLNVTTG
jgi:hypothetical protein